MVHKKNKNKKIKKKNAIQKHNKQPNPFLVLVVLLNHDLSTDFFLHQTCIGDIYWAHSKVYGVVVVDNMALAAVGGALSFISFQTPAGEYALMQAARIGTDTFLSMSVKGVKETVKNSASIWGTWLGEMSGFVEPGFTRELTENLVSASAERVLRESISFQLKTWIETFPGGTALTYFAPFTKYAIPGTWIKMLMEVPGLDQMSWVFDYVGTKLDPLDPGFGVNLGQNVPILLATYAAIYGLAKLTALPAFTRATSKTKVLAISLYNYWRQRQVANDLNSKTLMGTAAHAAALSAKSSGITEKGRDWAGYETMRLYNRTITVNFAHEAIKDRLNVPLAMNGAMELNGSNLLFAARPTEEELVDRMRDESDFLKNKALFDVADDKVAQLFDPEFFMAKLDQFEFCMDSTSTSTKFTRTMDVLLAHMIAVPQDKNLITPETAMKSEFFKLVVVVETDSLDNVLGQVTNTSSDTSTPVRGKRSKTKGAGPGPSPQMTKLLQIETPALPTRKRPSDAGTGAGAGSGAGIGMLADRRRPARQLAFDSSASETGKSSGVLAHLTTSAPTTVASDEMSMSSEDTSLLKQRASHFNDTMVVSTDKANAASFADETIRRLDNLGIAIPREHTRKGAGTGTSTTPPRLFDVNDCSLASIELRLSVNDIGSLFRKFNILLLQTQVLDGPALDTTSTTGIQFQSISHARFCRDGKLYTVPVETSNVMTLTPTKRMVIQVTIRKFSRMACIEDVNLTLTLKHDRVFTLIGKEGTTLEGSVARNIVELAYERFHLIVKDESVPDLVTNYVEVLQQEGVVSASAGGTSAGLLTDNAPSVQFIEGEEIDGGETDDEDTVATVDLTRGRHSVKVKRPLQKQQLEIATTAAMLKVVNVSASKKEMIQKAATGLEAQYARLKQSLDLVSGQVLDYETFALRVPTLIMDIERIEREIAVASATKAGLEEAVDSLKKKTYFEKLASGGLNTLTDA